MQRDIILDEEASSITCCRTMSTSSRKMSSRSATMNMVQTWRSGGCTGMKMSKLEKRQKWQLEKLNAQEYWKCKVLV